MRSTLLPMLAAICMFACKKKDDTTPVATQDVTFKTTFDGSRLIKYHNYTFNGYPLQISRFTLFLSDITLLKGSAETRISEVEYLDFTPDNANSDTSKLIKISFGKVPEGDYTGIKMGYGVKPANNAKSPADFSVNSPLANDNEYWIGWHSYIFSKIEGQGDADNNGQFDHFLVYHTGSDGVFKTFTFTQPIHVHAGGEPLEIEFDLKKVFTWDDGRPYNLVVDPITSNDRDSIRVANDLMNHFGKATTISQ